MPIYDSRVGLAQVGAKVAGTLSDLETNRQAVQTQDAQLKLQENTANAQNTPENINAAIEAVQAQNQAVASKQSRQATFTAFDAYNADKQPRHLNNLIKSEPSVKEAFGNVISFERANLETDAALLNQFGISEENFNSTRYLKTIMADGTAKIQDVGMLEAATGYLRYVDDRTLDRLIKESELFGTDNQGVAGELEKNANYLAGQGIEGGDEAKIANRLYLDKIAGNSVGQQEQADLAITSLFETFDGEENFFKTDFTKRENRVKAEQYIRRLETYGGIKLSAPDRADLKDLGVLIATADIVGETLTPEVTGAYDSVYRDVKKYVSDEVDDKVEASAAWTAFRNTTRRAMSGVALTATEVESFNQAFGTLKQKYPAVMAQFKTALIQTRAKLADIYEQNNPILTQYYMGNKTAELDKIIRGIDERLELFSKTGSTEEPAQLTEPGATPGGTQEGQPSLESILGPATVQQ